MGVPTYMYRRNGAEIEAKVFDSDAIPQGWFDSPKKCDEQPVKRRKGKARV